MQKWLDGCERVLTVVAVAATFGMMVLTTADAGGRYLFNRPILAAFELTTNYLMVAAVFLALPHAYRQGANIRVTFLVDRLGRRPRLVIDHAVQLISMLYCAMLVFATFQQASTSCPPGRCLPHSICRSGPGTWSSPSGCSSRP
jgi:TRAP-type C4-dicarboxylate transport system permease small subunit